MYDLISWHARKFNLLIRQSGALNATPAFGPLAIPVFLDKLTAGSRATKVNLMFSLTRMTY